MAGGRFIVAVDIGATKALLTTLPAVDERAWDRGIATLRTDTPRDPGQAVAWLVANALERVSAAGGRVAAVGLALPGPLDAERGIVTRSSNLGWGDLPLAAMVAERLGVPVVLEDDANAAALGEWRYGAGRGCDPFAYLTISSGIGSGIIADGRVVRGATGNAGEIGHLVMDPSGPRCACGRRGDVESYAGGAALARRARATWPRSLANGEPAPRDAAAVFRAARRGDPDAQRLAADAVKAVAAALAAVTAVIDPARIAVGGALALGQPSLIRRAAGLARRSVLAESGRRLEVVPAGLGEASVLAGAAAMALARAAA